MSAQKSFISIKNSSPSSSFEGQCIINGEFSVIYQEQGITVEAQNVLKHIAMTITDRGSYQVKAPFKDVVVFPDDVQLHRNGCSGYFNVSVFEHSDFNHSGTFYVTCSLGLLVSNTLKITRMLG